MSVPWGTVRDVICPNCGKTLSAWGKGSVPNHLPKGKPTSSEDCYGSGKKPQKVICFDNRTYNY